jgi:hypothetical protein
VEIPHVPPPMLFAEMNRYRKEHHERHGCGHAH